MEDREVCALCGDLITGKSARKHGLCEECLTGKRWRDRSHDEMVKREPEPSKFGKCEK